MAAQQALRPPPPPHSALVSQESRPQAQLALPRRSSSAGQHLAVACATAFLASSAPSAASGHASSNARPRSHAAASKGNGAAASAGEVFELEIERPYGIKFYRGEDGGIYVDALTPGYPGAKSGKIQEGDKLLATSGVFGDEMWPAADYGRTMYTIQQRVGPMIMRFEKRTGEKIGWFRQEEYLKERAAGNVGYAVRDKQAENYVMKMELQEKRLVELEEGLSLYNQGQYEEALRRFQAIMGLEPEYKEQGVAFYNIACCCAKLGQVKNGLDALDAAMKSGFDDYKKIRQDPDLSLLRITDEFDDIMGQYDSFINENAIKALFGFFGKK